MRTLRPFALSVALLAGAAAPLAAQATPAAPAASSDTRRDIVALIEDAERKFLALAEEIPYDKWSWRPAEGVRSIGEVFVHVAGGNYLFPRIVGVEPPATPFPRDAEKTITDRKQIIDLLRASFGYAKEAVNKVPVTELAAPVTMFGQQTTKGHALLVLATHQHEHLGQQIAYARMNQVVPPWSRRTESGGR